MSYFSRLALEEPAYYPDHSITEPEQRLQWRVEELQQRLETLRAHHAPYSSAACFLDEELRYMPAGSICTIYDGERALELAQLELTPETPMSILILLPAMAVAA